MPACGCDVLTNAPRAAELCGAACAARPFQPGSHHVDRRRSNSPSPSPAAARARGRGAPSPAERFPRASGAGGIARRPARQPDAGRHFAWKGGPTRLFDPGGSLIPQRQPAPGTMWGEGVGVLEIGVGRQEASQLIRQRPGADFPPVTSSSLWISRERSLGNGSCNTSDQMR